MPVNRDALRAAAGRVPVVVWWITGLHVTVLLAYSILIPTYRGPDEPEHVDLAHLFANERTYPDWDERDNAPGIERTKQLLRSDTGSAPLAAAESLPKDRRPALEDVELPPLPTRINQLPQHPPLYYAVAGSFERMTELAVGNASFDLEVWIYRLLSVLLCAPLPLVIWHTSRLLWLPASAGITATLVPLAIPQLSHIGSVVNNDSLLLLLFWLLTPLTVRLAHGRAEPRLAALAGLVTGLALLTKGFALVMPVWVLAALALGLHRAGRQQLRQTTMAAGAFVVTTVSIGGWWWLRNLALYHRLVPSRYDELLPQRSGAAGGLGTFLGAWASGTTQRFWGDFGWFDTHIPGLAVVLATTVCMAAIVAGCTRRNPSGTEAGTGRFGDRLLLIAPLALLVATQFAIALRGYLTTGFFVSMQGRYWFGAVAGLAVVTAFGLAKLTGRAGNLLPLGMLVAAGAMQLVGVRTILGHYWSAPGSSLGTRIQAMTAWAPLPGEVLLLGAVCGAAIAVGVIVQLAVLATGSAEAAPTLDGVALPRHVTALAEPVAN